MFKIWETEVKDTNSKYLFDIAICDFHLLSQKHVTPVELCWVSIFVSSAPIPAWKNKVC